MERHSTQPSDARAPRCVAVVGAGRLGTALAAALAGSGVEVLGPLGRGAAVPPAADAVLLCVPESQLAAAAAAISPGPLVGHCSGASTLEPLHPHEAFSLHPLMTVTPAGATFSAATAAIAGATPRALLAAEALARALDMRPVHVADADRAAYHAAASVASNFLVTLEGFAERLGNTAGIGRDELAQLVRASVENWAREGAAEALTGPIARGDEATVDRQREAVAARLPDDLELFDALAEATRRLAAAPQIDVDHMKTLRTVADLRAVLHAPRRAGRSIGLVPTMGALHEGHLSLIRLARASCDVVVTTLFVNPAQFNEAADIDAYPRDEERDARLAAEAGADVLFAPPPEEVYPDGFATRVTVAGVTAPLEGEHRGAEHFAGVATVVAKLLNMAQPDVAYFGQKDAQQVAVIRRLVRDLDIPVRIEVGATVREPGGLALSSRNVRLAAADRDRALALRRALDAIGAAADGGESDAAALAAAGRAAMSALGVEPEYLELVAPETFSPVARLNGEPVLAAVAARIGDVRLIDNEILTPTTSNGSD